MVLSSDNYFASNDLYEVLFDSAFTKMSRTMRYNYREIHKELKTEDKTIFKMDKKDIVNSSSNHIIHHTSNSAYDRTALRILSKFLKYKPERRRKAFLSYLLKTNQMYSEFDTFILVHNDSITFRKTVEEVYTDALNYDLQHASFIHFWRTDGITHYICVVEASIFGDREMNLYDADGHLKQVVKDEAIQLIKKDLMIE